MTTDKKILTLEEIRQNCLDEAKKALQDSFSFPRPIKKAAVIGAGPSGLTSARHLRDAGFNVKLFDRSSFVGGVWSYSERPRPKPKMPTSRITNDPPSDIDALSDEPKKKMLEMTPEMQKLILTKKPPSACYRDLHNNTATHLFSLPDYDFPEGTPYWVPHHVIQEYFEGYAEHFDLNGLIELDTSVDFVTKNEQDNTWELTLSKYDVYTSGMVRESRWKETFDAVVVASGLHQDPFVPDIDQLTAYNKIYPDRTSHSVQYRKPEDFKDKHVVVVGGHISAIDIVRALEGFAKTITISIKGPFESPVLLFNLLRAMIPKSVSIKPAISSFSNKEGNVDGSVVFEDGTTLDDIDHVIFCTGFLSRIPFMGDLVIPKKSSDIQTSTPRPTYADVPKSHVVMGPHYPLNVYRESFLMSDPTLAFVGFGTAFSMGPHFDTQARAVARVWSGAACLPNTELMYKLASEYENGADPYDQLNEHRKKREPYVVWLNYHAQELGKGDLKKVENYPEDYEEECMKTMEAWKKDSEDILQKTKAYIREHYL